MSLRAMVWVLHDAPTKNHAEFAVLMALADRAGSDEDEGAAAYPSHRWIAEKVQCSVATVKRHLKELESRGLIRRGDQSLVGKYRSDRRPVVWDLDLSLHRVTVAQNEPPKKQTTAQDEPSPENTVAQPGSDGSSTSAPRQLNHDTTVAHSYELQTILKPSLNHPEPSNPPVVPQRGHDTNPDSEVSTIPDPPAPAKKTKRGTRLPEGFYPTQRSIQIVCQKLPGATKDYLEFEHTKFTNHFSSQPGAKGAKLDWDATWQNWILNSVSYLRTSEQTALRTAPGSAPAPGHVPAPPTKQQSYRDAAAQLRAQAGVR